MVLQVLQNLEFTIVLCLCQIFQCNHAIIIGRSFCHRPWMPVVLWVQIVSPHLKLHIAVESCSCTHSHSHNHTLSWSVWLHWRPGGAPQILWFVCAQAAKQVGKGQNECGDVFKEIGCYGMQQMNWSYRVGKWKWMPLPC